MTKSSNKILSERALKRRKDWEKYLRNIRRKLSRKKLKIQHRKNQLLKTFWIETEFGCFKKKNLKWRRYKKSWANMTKIALFNQKTNQLKASWLWKTFFHFLKPSSNQRWKVKKNHGVINNYTKTSWKILSKKEVKLNLKLIPRNYL